MANWVLDDFILVGFPWDIQPSATGCNRVPWRHGHKYIICGVPDPLQLSRGFFGDRCAVDVDSGLPGFRVLRRKGPVIALLVVHNYCAIGMGDEEKGGGCGDPSYCRARRVGYATLFIETGVARSDGIYV
jgi:hypothetical protein